MNKPKQKELIRKMKRNLAKAVPAETFDQHEEAIKERMAMGYDIQEAYEAHINGLDDY